VPEAAGYWREALRLNSANNDARANLAEAERRLEGAGSVPVEQEARLVRSEDLPSDTLVSLYREALRREPTNGSLREAYLNLCRERKLTCPEQAP